MDKNCLTQENMRKVYLSLKNFILTNANPEKFEEVILESGETQPYHTGTNFQYYNINFRHLFVENNNKQGHPKFNMKTIEVNANGIGYTLLYGSYFGDSSVSIEIKDYSEEKGKIIQQKAEEHFCKVLCKMNFNIISSKEVIEIAEKSPGSFWGTWINAELKDHYWHLKAESKSATPPMYCIIDANDGAILLKLDNSDDPKQQKELKKFLNKISKDPFIMNNETSCFSAANFDKVYKYISEQLKKSNNSFYLYEEYELYLQENEIALKKDAVTRSVINKKEGIYSLNKVEKNNKYMVDKTHQIFCKLIERATTNKD